MSQKLSLLVRAAGAAGAVVGVLAMAGMAYAAPVLSQTSITVGVGQSTSVTATNGASVYVGNNSSPTLVSVAVNGMQITLTGVAPGSANISLCTVGTASDCMNLGVTVQTGNVTGITFSQNNPSLSISASQLVTVSGGNGTYHITSNSNVSVASTSFSGNSLTVTGLATGGAAISVCDTAGVCGTLSVTVNTSGTSNIIFSQNNLSLPAGSSQGVTISGGNGTYHITSNSNVSAASAGMSGSGVTVYATAPGSATITICDGSNVCGTLSMIVTASNANQNVTFSVASPSLTVGQSLNVTLSGNATSYVVLSNTSPNIVQATINNNVTLSLYGVAVGTDSLTICATGGGCSPLSVTVTGSTSAATTTTTTIIVPPVQTTTPVTQPVSVVANTALLGEIQALQALVTQVLGQIQSIQTQLNQLRAQVSAGSGSGISTSVSASASSGTSNTFTDLLTVGLSGVQVTALQERLQALGFYSGPVTGFYGALTGQAVSKYQTAHGITATGYVGPSTRAALNTGN